MAETEHCFARTRPNIGRTSFVWSINQFSIINPGEEKTTSINSSFCKDPLLNMKLFLEQSFEGLYLKEQVKIEVMPLNVGVKDNGLCICTLSLLDFAGNVAISTQDKMLFETPGEAIVHSLSSFLTKKDAMG
ncbi:hypothetical protein CEXT_99731 [Caerostris extrusa]|uniref:Uncharacterized protein n=1 Tax=Caerostris extrusa TaxID=172846 RepID=A0AAV4SSI7_CAEEX|nr:hypothetical protein CEXT_99731 [Caerostris extrusa]